MYINREKKERKLLNIIKIMNTPKIISWKTLIQTTFPIKKSNNTFII